MSKKLIYLVSFVLMLSLAGSAWSVQILIDDDFNGEGLDIGDAESVNGGFTLVTNALGAAESTAVETGSNAEVSTLGGNNANTGIVSNASFDPLSEAALTEGLTVKWVVTSIGPSVHANGNTYMIQTEGNVFFNTMPHIGLEFSGVDTDADHVGVRFRDPPRGIDRTIISTHQPYEHSSWMDGFTAEFTISQTGWSYKVTGLNDPYGTPTILTESNTWVGSGLAETFLSDLLDNDCYVSAFAQEAGCTANYDRCIVHIGELPVWEATNLGPANGATGVQRDVTLSWTPGTDIDKHDVYFDSNFDNVNDATRDNPLGVLVSQNQDPCSYEPGVLDFGTTYYWRIDEVEADGITIHKGRVWQFTVEPFAYTMTSENIIATASSSNSADETPENTINGSGLDADDLHSVVGTDMWLSSAADPNAAWIQYEFDKVYKLHEMWVWNYNTSLEPVLGFGVKDATIEYSADGNDWTALGDFEFARASGTAGYAANTTFDLSGVIAKYFKITANSNWGGIMPQSGLSEVRFFYVPVLASQPIPLSGATDMAVDNVTLNWRAGREAASHEVQLSTDQQAVIEGNAPVVSVSGISYDTGELQLAQTYYWKIVEVNEAETPTNWQGDVWNFTTSEFLVVEDFEDYNNSSPHRVFQRWIDGIGFSADEFFPVENPGNGSGAAIGHDIWSYDSPHYDGAIMETVIVHVGVQSAPLYYDNSTANYSEVTADVANLQAGQDWTKHGINALTLWFRGDPNNVVDQMYVKLNGSKVLYDGEAANLTRAQWQPWNIDLVDFGVNLSNVTGLSIGIERSGAIGGKGIVYVDDIRLYPYSRELVTPAEPDTASLVAHYEFEGNANDSSVNGLHGTIMGEPNFVAGMLGQTISLDGVDDYVEITGYKGICTADPNDPNSVQPAFSITAWINTSGDGEIMGWGSTPGGTSRVEFRINEDRLRCESGGNVQGDNTLPDNEWVHVAVTVKENATISYPDVKLYLNGQDDTRKTTDPDALNVVAGYDVTIGRRHTSGRWFDALIDDVRIYELALSDAEVAWLAGRIKPFDNPF